MCYGITVVEPGPFQCYKLGPAVADLSKCATTTAWNLGHTYVKINRRNGISLKTKTLYLSWFGSRFIKSDTLENSIH